MATERFTFSTFLRSPNSVTAVLERDDALIERRDGSDFMVRSVERDRQERETVAALGWALPRIAALDEFAEVLASEDGPFPWVRYLPKPDRRLFVRELGDALRATADLGSFAGVQLTVSQWRRTAEIHADPHLTELLSAPVPDPLGEPVALPEK